MTDWIRDNAWASWLAVAVVLAVIEMMSLDLVLLMFAVGALAAAVAAGLGAPVWITLPLFALVSLALLFFVRPPFVAKLHDGPTLQTGHANLIGSSALVVEPVDQRGGRIRLAGELWSARTLDPVLLDTGAEVLVTRIDGATAVVTSSSPSTLPKEL
ncbi:NfeD family protein [Aeromicrobium wangtongii]|uniref:NfeD family protein n=1 Tax=Aeromicrobium wangtongii TaxID=2969247 RepID=A0ABY5MB67_9ACTN|nr:NfeD family protein [Aeromicrobium wangtongii]MCD9197886.1 NfeD family protein [Aeromicrobium wangtongii]UUP15365.1 NfeD family protein [Aeromicrobium wangtongii]